MRSATFCKKESAVQEVMIGRSGHSFIIAGQFPSASARPARASGRTGESRVSLLRVHNLLDVMELPIRKVGLSRHGAPQVEENVFRVNSFARQRRHTWGGKKYFF